MPIEEGKAIIVAAAVIGSGMGNGLAGISKLTHRLSSLRILMLYKPLQPHLV